MEKKHKRTLKSKGFAVLVKNVKYEKKTYDY